MKVTYLLIVSWVLASFFFWNLPAEQEEAFINQYAYSTQNVLAGKLWVFLTSIFLHGDIVHLALNSVAFLFFGLAAEKELGWKRMLLVFFIGAFAGDALSSFIYPPSALSIGASGGVSAVLGAAMLVAPFGFTLLPFPAPILLVGILYIISNLIGLFYGVGSGISYAAHVGGLALGLAYGFNHVGKKKGVVLILIGAALYAVFAILYFFLLG